MHGPVYKLSYRAYLHLMYIAGKMGGVCTHCTLTQTFRPCPKHRKITKRSNFLMAVPSRWVGKEQHIWTMAFLIIHPDGKGTKTDCSLFLWVVPSVRKRKERELNHDVPYSSRQFLFKGSVPWDLRWVLLYIIPKLSLRPIIALHKILSLLKG